MYDNCFPEEKPHGNMLDFKVFTLNCWALAVVSKNRKSRILAIAEVISKNNYDVVCLQEVWTNRDFFLLRDGLHKCLPYSHYFYSGVTGSGICILSKHPIEETFFHQWSVNGYIHKLHHGDWWGGKGVALCRLRVKQESTTYFVNVYSTHLHAEYNRASDDYQAHRVLQAYDTAQFILLTSGSSDLIVLAGDLNTEPGDLAYRVLLTVPGLKDAYIEAGNVSQEKFATCEALQNSYTPAGMVKQKLLGKRIDYVMYHPGSGVNVDLKKYCLPLPDRVPNQTYSYSDHEAIYVELLLTKGPTSAKKCLDDSSKGQVLEECIVLCNEALKSISKTKFLYWSAVIILFILFLISLIVPALVEFDFTQGIPTVVAIIRVIVTALFLFCFLMATLWSRIEMHGVLSGKLAMEMSLKKIRECPQAL
ncbi:putative neutral sphingomyelinase [Anthonomus grandis grandis]|uniref:putative neutral sphingomyelinase n=1 Tax=Anthonomus grandis grandis TaxID=2921223 RepID=UPI0021666068|nr:putative neutral sphingomyelinase [Anthonomus grandis grandis]